MGKRDKVDWSIGREWGQGQ